LATITESIVKKILHHLYKGEDYRIEIVTLINAEFLDYVISFFKKIVDAKLRNETINIDWYKKEFLNKSLPSNELIIYSGLNKKTISNMYNSASREIVLQATEEHYSQLYQTINELVANENEIDVTLTLKLNGVSVDLNISESLIVINVLAVKRAELRGGAWSSAGKQVEKNLMVSLCKLYKIPSTNYELTGLTKENREVDFYLISRRNNKYHCEVKLMGKGNPESADGTFNARETHVFIADKLSDTNKNQLNLHRIHWVELRQKDGFKKFPLILKELDIPYTDFSGDITARLEEIFTEMF